MHVVISIIMVELNRARKRKNIVDLTLAGFPIHVGEEASINV